jgi:hypothetical protein
VVIVFTQNARIRPRIRTTAEAAEWLRQWNSHHCTRPDEMVQRPWRTASPQVLMCVAASLLNWRALYDSRQVVP